DFGMPDPVEPDRREPMIREQVSGEAVDHGFLSGPWRSLRLCVNSAVPGSRKGAKTQRAVKLVSHCLAGPASVGAALQPAALDNDSLDARADRSLRIVHIMTLRFQNRDRIRRNCFFEI